MPAKPKIRKRLTFGKWILPAVTIIAALCLFWLVRSLERGAYITKAQDLLFLDSIVVQDQAYRRGSGRSSNSAWQFQDTGGQWFELATADAFYDPRLINDTLRYHGTKLAVFTDRDGWETFRAQRKKERIPILQLSLNGKEQIDLDRLNQEQTNNRRAFLVFVIVCYLLFVIVYTNNSDHKPRPDKMDNTG